ncbi:MAG: D-alanyl-D-alanine carboxypeptidase [Oscillospiraceae bacterium]|nr:D-alanyl-D-alanine carboxypeptidase [Oscillospiraceae bacterium]
MKMLRILLSVILIYTLLPLTAKAETLPRCTSALLEAQTGMCIGGTEPDLQVPAGTQTKLMTVYLTAEAAASGKFTPETVLTVPPSAEGAPGASIWLRSGEKMSVLDLLRGVIVGNANDACIALACAVSGSEDAFVRDMNAEAFSLGMRSTVFADCTGLSAENRTSAHDLGTLCRALLRHDWLQPIFATWRCFLRGDATELVNENRLTRTDEALSGFKAGHGDASGYTLTLAAKQDQMTFIAVVLGSPDSDQRFTDAKKLLAKGFAEFYVTTPDLSAEFMQPVRVHHGTDSAVLVQTSNLLSIAAPRSESLSTAVVLPRWLEAPVQRGDVIGTAAFYCGDTLLYESPLTAADDVPRRSFLHTLQMLIAAL